MVRPAAQEKQRVGQRSKSHAGSTSASSSSSSVACSVTNPSCLCCVLTCCQSLPGVRAISNAARPVCTPMRNSWCCSPQTCREGGTLNRRSADRCGDSSGCANQGVEMLPSQTQLWDHLGLALASATGSNSMITTQCARARGKAGTEHDPVANRALEPQRSSPWHSRFAHPGILQHRQACGGSAVAASRSLERMQRRAPRLG